MSLFTYIKDKQQKVVDTYMDFIRKLPSTKPSYLSDYGVSNPPDFNTPTIEKKPAKMPSPTPQAPPHPMPQGVQSNPSVYYQTPTKPYIAPEVSPIERIGKELKERPVQTFFELFKGAFRGTVLEPTEFMQANVLEPTAGRLGDEIIGMIRGTPVTDSEHEARQDRQEAFNQAIKEPTMPSEEADILGNMFNTLGEYVIPGAIGEKLAVTGITKFAPKLLANMGGTARFLVEGISGAMVSDPIYTTIRRAGEENEKNIWQDIKDEFAASVAGTFFFGAALAPLHKGFKTKMKANGLADETIQRMTGTIDKHAMMMKDYMDDAFNGSYHYMVDPRDVGGDVRFGESRLTFMTDNAKQSRNTDFKRDIVIVGGSEKTIKNFGTKENPMPAMSINDEIKLLSPPVSGDNFIMTQVVPDAKLPKNERIKQAKVRQRAETSALKSLESKNQPLTKKKEKMKAAGLEYDFVPMEKELMYKLILKKNLRSAAEIDDMVSVAKERGVSDAVIDDFTIFGNKLSDLEIIKKEQNGVVSAVWTKDEVANLLDSYQQKLTPDEVEQLQRRYPNKDNALAKAKNVAAGFEEPQLFFHRTGLKDIYDMVRGGEGRTGGRRAVVTRIIAESERVLKPFKELSREEAENVWAYVAARQGYIDSTIELTAKEQNALDIFDAWNRETQGEFFDIAKLNGTEPGKVEGYFPMRTRDDLRFDKNEEIGWDRALKNYRSFSSLKERMKGQKPTEYFEKDVRKIVSQYIHDQAEFIEMGKVLPKVKALIESDPIKKNFTTGDWGKFNDWFGDITKPNVPKSEWVRGVSHGADKLRHGVSRSLISSLSTGLKQFLVNFQVLVTEGIVPTTKYNDIIKNLPTILERQGGDFVIRDMTGKVDRAIFTIPRVMDAVSAKATGGGILAKELKKRGVELVDLPKHEQDIILNMVQDKIDFLYGGVTTEQLPTAYRNALGKNVFAFTRPTTSLFNYALKKGIDKGAKGYLEGALFLAVGAYMEQVVTNLSFNWSSPDEVAKDVAKSWVSNVPLVSILVYPLSSGQSLELATLSGLNNVIKEMYDGDGNNTEMAFALAEAFGLPSQIRKGVEGYEFIKDEGRLSKQGEVLAPMTNAMEGVRALYRGKNAPLAVQEYLNNVGRKSDERAWLFPEVEFFQNGDYVRKAQIYKQLGDEDGNVLLNQLTEGQQSKLQPFLLAAEYPDVQSERELREVWERKEINLDERGRAKTPTEQQLYAHMRKVALLNGADERDIVDMPKRWRPRDGITYMSDFAKQVQQDPRLVGISKEEVERKLQLGVRQRKLTEEEARKILVNLF